MNKWPDRWPGRWPLTLGAFALLAIPLLACSDVEPGDAAPTDEPAATEEVGRTTDKPTPTAGSPEDLPSELQEMLEDVADLRGLEPPDDLTAALLPRSELPQTLENLTTEDDLRYFADLTTIYRLLGYIENDQDYYDVYNSFGAEGILGFYLPSEDKLWVVYEDGDEPEWDDLPFLEETTLAHELVHAIQDYHFDIGETSLALDSDLDANMAYTALVEGDASTFENEYVEEYMLAVPGPSGGALLLRGNPAAAQAGVSEAIIRSLYFPYITGADWVTSLYEDGGTGAVDAIFEDPKLATSYILHPELLDDWEPETVELEGIEDALGEGWEMESEGVFGEFHIANYLQVGLGRIVSESAAAGWQGDRYEAWRNGDDTVFVTRIVFEDAAEAAEFYETHAGYLEDTAEEEDAGLSGGRRFFTLEDGDVAVIVETDGDTVAFAIASTFEAAEAVAAALD